jgi:hypothetical protein
LTGTEGRFEDNLFLYLYILAVVHPIDLTFLIDGSINAGEDNFHKELTFVRKLCNRLVLLGFSNGCRAADDGQLHKTAVDTQTLL